MELSYKMLRKKSKIYCILLIFISVVVVNGNAEVNKKVKYQFNKCENEICNDKPNNGNFNEESSNFQINTGEEFYMWETTTEVEYAKTENDLIADEKVQNRKGKNVSLSLGKLISFINETELVMNNSGSLYEIFNVTESSSQFFEDKEKTTHTSEVNFTELIIKSTTKLLPTLPPYDLLNALNISKRADICFCDLKVNECDINCCCDQDCSGYHLKVFTKCIDTISNYDPKYCYKSNFLFSNNSKHKILKNEGGLFCIAKSNLPITIYKTKNIITTLDSFRRHLPKTLYTFYYKDFKKNDIKLNKYYFGSLIWVIQNNEIKPFRIPIPTVGFLCTSYLNVRYLIDKESVCAHSLTQIQKECGYSKNDSSYFGGIKVISNPNLINISENLNLSKICENGSCIEISFYKCQISYTIQDCLKNPESVESFKKLKCLKAASKIYYYIWHNGTDGIKKISAYIWSRNLSNNLSDSLLQITKVTFLWVDTPTNIFQRSGNPGYLKQRPILAGKKVYYATNSTTEKKEAIEISLNSNNWLSVIGSENGICSLSKRLPINFGENGLYSCSLALTKNYFGKTSCVELQNYIFKLLVGNDIDNATVNNYFNKFVATFGNSEIEKTGDWAQVLLDLFPIFSSQVGFKSNYNSLVCKNMITDLYIDIAYANIGSFFNPQAKILGTTFHFGKHKDLVFYCNNLGCKNNSFTQNFRLTSEVHFIDTTEPAEDAFADPLGLELKLPHDFFYPFFSIGSQLKPFKACFFISLIIGVCI